MMKLLSACFFALTIASTVLICPRSYALSCMPAPAKEELKASEIVFLGTVQSATEGQEKEGSTYRPATANMKIDLVIKGSVKKDELIDITRNVYWWGKGYWKSGEAHLIFASKKDGEFRIKNCSNSGLSKNQHAQDALKNLGVND